MKKDNHKEEKKIIKSICLSVFSIVICTAIMSTATWAWFRPTVTVTGSIVAAESFPGAANTVLAVDLEATPTPSPAATKEPEEATPSPEVTKEPEEATPSPEVTKEPEEATPSPAATEEPDTPTPTPVPETGETQTEEIMN